MGWTAPTALAADLPPPAEAAALSGTDSVTIEVRNPHLGLGADAPLSNFRGFPAAAMLDALLGAGWRGTTASAAGDRPVDPGGVVRLLEFRAADGYVSTIPAAQFLRHRAWLVYARADGADFVTDNVYLGKRNLPLGPWYLVWDNIGAPELIPLGDHYWPYQVVEVSVTTP